MQTIKAIGVAMLLIVILFGCGDGGGGDAPAQPSAVNATGTWRGPYNSNRFGALTVTLNMLQNGAALTGTYSSSNGASGKISGYVTGIMAIYDISITTQDCIGGFDGFGIVNTQTTPYTMSFDYIGSEVCGSTVNNENGTGNLVKQ